MMMKSFFFRYIAIGKKNVWGVFIIPFFFPALPAEARLLTAISDFFAPTRSETLEVAVLDESLNSQNLALLQAVLSSSQSFARGGGDIMIVGSALMPESGPSGTLADTVDSPPVSDQVVVYVVRKGDTLSAIATAFNVSVNTVIWANDIKNGVIHEGQTLVILPINGVLHTVKKGDTLQSIAKQYKGDITEIAQFNNISAHSVLALGEEILVPNGKKMFTTSVTRTVTSKIRGAGGPDLGDYYIRPVYGGTISQGLHGYNGVDLAAPRGTTIVASAGGVVIVARGSGWNGGYGNYIVVAHPNGTQTLYAHLDRLATREGVEVAQGQLIGYSGSTGRSTGPHLHFEVRGAKNPFAR